MYFGAKWRRVGIEQTHKHIVQKSLPQHIGYLLNIYTPYCMQYSSGLSLCGGSIGNALKNPMAVVLENLEGNSDG